jgi:hypothetical protein
VPEREAAKPSLPSGQAYARDQAKDDDADDDRRFDADPDE